MLVLVILRKFMLDVVESGLKENEAESQDAQVNKYSPKLDIATNLEERPTSHGAQSKVRPFSSSFDNNVLRLD